MQKDITVAFEIKTTKVDAVAKASMKKVFQTIFAEDHKNNYDAFITDSTGRMFCFTLQRSEWGFTLSCENCDDEHDTATTYEVFWMNGQHRAVDYAEAYYEVNRY